MKLADYYEILGLPVNSSVEEIKKAYRKKARLYHPDINTAPEAKDLFIMATEAYEFLLANHDKMITDEQAYYQAMEDWRKYRQDRSRKRAQVYAQSSYVHFKSTKFYRTTRILDGTTIFISLVVSVLVLFFTIFGYIFRLRHPIPGLDKPSVLSLIFLLTLGMIFFGVSFIYLMAYNETSKKQKKKK